MHVNSECPICSVIHRNQSNAEEETEKQFTPRKRTKGIIYYGDRIEELLTSPQQLVMNVAESIAASPSSLSENIVKTQEQVHDVPEQTPKKRRGRPKRQI